MKTSPRKARAIAIAKTGQTPICRQQAALMLLATAGIAAAFFCMSSLGGF